MSRCSASPSPSLVPLPLETGAQVQGFSPTALEFTAETDSALEEGGFELSVPPDRCGGTRYDLGRPFYGPVGISSSEPRRFCAVASEPPCLSQRPCRESLIRFDSDRYNA